MYTNLPDLQAPITPTVYEGVDNLITAASSYLGKFISGSHPSYRMYHLCLQC